MNLLANVRPSAMNVLDPSTIRDISPEILDEQGNIRVMPAGFYEQTTKAERALFGFRQSAYGFITEELVGWLQRQIGGRSAIEIGAGNGVLSDALGIPATDNRMQEDPLIVAAYTAAGQPTVKYGANVERLDAAAAVRKYKPQVVVANWVTHLYREERREHGGNAFGVNEEDIIANCETYIFIGNERVHEGKSVWHTQPEFVYVPHWLYSRSMQDAPNFIACWKGGKHP